MIRELIFKIITTVLIGYISEYSTLNVKTYDPGLGREPLSVKH